MGDKLLAYGFNKKILFLLIKLGKYFNVYIIK